jgi:hypothetical protein
VSRSPSTVVASVLAVAAGSLVAMSPASGAADGGSVRASAVSVPTPTLSTPTVAGNGIQTLLADLSQLPQYGYVQQEYFMAGTARAYNTNGPVGANGQWSITKASSAAYKTRLIVRRPQNPANFNGTVVVEWLNVTAGVDSSPDWNYGRTELMREGFAWVGVSAQAVGTNALVTGDPARYGTLVHPGDPYSYDIFSQAAQALVRPQGASPLGGATPRWLIADGESQSASRMTTYVNAFAAHDHAYDAYMIHSRSAGAAALNTTGAGSTLPNPTFIRTDIPTPVMVLESETDVPRYFPARQPDSDHYRGWEVAGTAHVDKYDLGAIADALGCGAPVNDGPHHFVFHRALHDLQRWMRTPWRPPASSPRMTVDAQGVLARDPLGNVLGGIRTPELDVPLATYTGVGTGPLFCVLAGTSTHFSTAQLTSLYGNRSEYLRRYLIAEGRALDQRFLLAVDAPDVFAEAQAVPLP